MQKNNPTAFISYSWDSKEHQQWIINLTNDLRKQGVDASNDVFITQMQTVNLNTMMVSKIKNSDYIVIVLTENYAQKADEIKGGVGFETILTMPYLRENLGKLILIMRHQGDYAKVFPFHYKDVYAIDFSNDKEYKEKLNELVYKIYSVPLYEIADLGPIPDLKPKKTVSVSTPAADNRLIPRLKKITDMDKSQFLKEAYQQICSKLRSLFEQTKQRNEEFDFTCEEITSRKTIFGAYINGNKKTGLKIWYGGSMLSSEAIYLSFGSHLNESSDGSFNEMINCEIDDKNELRLKQVMNTYGNKESNDIDTIAEDIWLYHIKNYIER